MTLRQEARFRLPWHVGLCTLIWTLHAISPSVYAAKGVHIVVYADKALVTEHFTKTLKQGEQELVLDDIPAEADLATLVIRERRVPLSTLEIERISVILDHRAVSDRGAIMKSEDGSSVVWKPENEASSRGRAEKLHPVRCRLRTPMAGKHRLTISYVVPGLAWQAAYEIAVRDAGNEAISVDMAGMVRIHNPTSRSFDGARVRVVGSDVREDAEKQDPPGFVMLGNDPAFDKIFEREDRTTPIAHGYDVPGTISLSALSETAAPFVKVKRVPAERLYVMRAEDFPAGTLARRAPLQESIVFRNRQSKGLDRPMPPGVAHVYRGGRRSFFLGDAWLPHTPANGEIRIDLGDAEHVRGARAGSGHEDIIEGYAEERFQVLIENGGKTDIRVEVDEKPPLTLEWDVISSTKAYVIEDNRLLFRNRVAADAESRIMYKLRVKQPAL